LRANSGVRQELSTWREQRRGEIVHQPVNKKTKDTTTMKTKINNIKNTAITLLAAFVVLGLATSTINAQEKGSAKGGAQGLMKSIKTTQDADAVEAGDTMVMACPKCQTISYTYVDNAARGAIKDTKVGTKHLCPGCETTIKSQGTGKHAKDEIVHVCKMCGTEDAFCCVMKKGSGPTKGMDKEETK
jgi:predicted metal-binding protein